MSEQAWFSGALDLRAYKPGEWVLLEPFRYHAGLHIAGCARVNVIFSTGPL